MVSLEERVSRIEAVIPHLATKEDIARLQGSFEENMAKMQGVFKEDIARLQGSFQEEIARLQGSFTTMNRMLAIGAPLLVGAMIAAIKFL